MELRAATRLMTTQVSATVKYSKALMQELDASPKKTEILRQLEDFATKLSIVKYDTEDSDQGGWLELRGQVKGGLDGNQWWFDVNVRTGKIKPDTQTKKKLLKLG